MKKHEALTAIAAFFVTFIVWSIVVYIIGAFIFASFDIAKWSESYKVISSTLSLIVTCTITGVVLDHGNS